MEATLLTALQMFRMLLYACLTQRRDALFDLTDALSAGGTVPTPVHLSLHPAHRRGWGSLYAALRHGGLDVPALQALLRQHPLASGQPIYAVDLSVWPRCDAETSPQRGYYYHPSRHSAGQPIVAGWAYQWLAQLSFAQESWTAPLDVRRVHPTENANTVAGTQITAFMEQYPPEASTPLFVFDAGYDPVQLTQAVPAPAAILVRLRSDRCFYADPASQAWTGRPRQHGHKFVCADPTTWLPPTATHQEEDRQYGWVQVQAWADLHPKQQNHAARGSRRTRPIVRGTLVRVVVARLPARPQPPKILWLWWHGPGAPDLAQVWRAYVRRFDLEHTFRFAKQTLNWTTPRVRQPEQADCWTWLIVLAYTQLRLARAAVADQRLPWERPYEAAQLTPYRVRRAFWNILPTLGTPAGGPKPCGRSPGRPKGRRSQPAPRAPALKKAA
jgi:hypothetical protein